jgi:c-di-AMP phosphodiesterase-like protein
MSDLDSVGATLGICCAVRATGRPCYAVVDVERSAAQELAQRAMELPEYQGVFISQERAMELCDAQSLLVVVDTSNPAIVDAADLLETIPRVAVIDHHRRGSGYIENPIIRMTESYASSASELVTELLQYIIKPSQLLKTEAEGLLSGIVLDTKSFTVKAGVRTFEAAAWLKQCGADTVEARRMYSGDLQGYLKKFQLMAAAHPVAEGMSVAVSDNWVDRAVAAQAADELINLSGIDAAFTVAREGSGCFVSARSYGAVNVQVVMEKIGGGGSLNQAGAQFSDKTPDEVETLLEQAIFAYVEDMKKAEEPQSAPAGSNTENNANK